MKSDPDCPKPLPSSVRRAPRRRAKPSIRHQNANVARTAALGQYHVESFAAEYAQLDLIVDGEPHPGKVRMRRGDVHLAAYAIDPLDDQATVMRHAPHGAKISVRYLLNHDQFPY
jgi:hypothetical protein